MALIQHPSVHGERTGGGKRSGSISNLASRRERSHHYYHHLSLLLFIIFFPVANLTFLLSSFKYLRLTTLQVPFLWTEKHTLTVNTLTLQAVLDVFKTFTWNNLRVPFATAQRQRATAHLLKNCHAAHLWQHGHEASATKGASCQALGCAPRTHTATPLTLPGCLCTCQSPQSHRLRAVQCPYPPHSHCPQFFGHY